MLGLLRWGTPQEVGKIEDCSFTQLNSIVTPSFVNTHTHLDLSGAGTAPAADSFTSWVEDIVFPIRSDEDAIQSSTLRGIELVQSGGSMIIGDISGTLEAANTVNDSALRSTIFC